MRIYIGSDHGGYELKHYLISKFKEAEFIDVGHKDYDKKDDYPEIAHQVAEKVLADSQSLGVLVCGSGLGMSMAANRHQGIRAAVCTSVKLAKLSRQHNNANILCLGGRIAGKSRALKILKKFVKTKFEGGRHSRRVEAIEL